ncbi:MAG: thiamine pyrophosphate-dependent enzyme [Anaerolineae bacterium]
MTLEYTSYLRNEKMPTQWCSGCGLGNLMKAIVRAIYENGIHKNDVAVVSGIGCSGRMSSYMDCNTLHTPHGRTLPFATGIKTSRPDKHVIVVSGDGDAMAIGGNHFIHACRRNIDLTLIVANNFTYGLTGGQFSPTTPVASWSPTTPYGNIEPSFDICAMAEAANATFIARTTVANLKHMSEMIRLGMSHPGMSVIEVITNCHVNYGRRNQHPEAPEMVHWIRERCVDQSMVEVLPMEALEGKFVVGVLSQKQRPEYTAQWAAFVEKVRDDAI